MNSIRDTLKAIMQGKDLWLIRALVLTYRLKNAGLEADDVLKCNDKRMLYAALEGEVAKCNKQL